MTTQYTYDSSFVDVLLDDVVSLQAQDQNSGVIRRALIRAIMSAIEGMLWNLQRNLLLSAEHKLSEFEAAALREVSYTITDKGEVREGVAKISLKTRVKFGANLLARIHPESKIDFSGREWQKLLDSIDVRDRLTHPKDRSKLEVSVEELGAAVEGLTWFLIVVSGTWHDGINAYLQTSEAKTRMLIKALRGVRPGVPED